MLLERGDVVTLGKPHDVANEYVRLNFDVEAREEAREQAEEREQSSSADDATQAPAPPPRERFGDGRATIEEAWVEDERGERVEALPHGSACTFKARVRFHEPLRDPLLGITVVDDREFAVFATSTAWAFGPTGEFGPGEEALLAVSFELPFKPGRYFVHPAIAARGGGLAWIDRRERFVTFLVTGTRDPGAAVTLPHDLTLERLGEPAGRVPA
jgi:hypothetical protein